MIYIINTATCKLTPATDYMLTVKTNLIIIFISDVCDRSSFVILSVTNSWRINETVYT